MPVSLTILAMALYLCSKFDVDKQRHAAVWLDLFESYQAAREHAMKAANFSVPAWQLSR